MVSSEDRYTCTVQMKHANWDIESEPAIQPHLIVKTDAKLADLQDALFLGSDDNVIPKDIDVSCRVINKEVETDDSFDGRLSITNRVTGEYILEGTVAFQDMKDFAVRAKEYGQRTETIPYAVELQCADEETRQLPQRVFLMYNAEGDVIRELSVIPQDVIV